jgi:hypothetical protein
MKKLILLLSAVIFYNSTTQGQPVVPSTTPYTRTLLPLPTQAAWQAALGITGGGGGGLGAISTNSVLVPLVNFNTNGLTTSSTNTLFTAPSNGTYVVSGQIDIPQNSTGTIAATLQYTTIQPLSKNFTILSSVTPSGINAFPLTVVGIEAKGGTSVNLIVTLSGDGGNDIYNIYTSVYQQGLVTNGGIAATNVTLPVTIAQGGTGQTTASAARTALGTAGLTDNNAMSGSNNFSGSVRLANTYFANGVFPGPNFVFDASSVSGGDESISISGYTNSSGAGFVFDILSAVPDSTLNQTPNGYPIADVPQIVGVPTGAPYVDFPGALLFVSPFAEMDFGHNNQPMLVIAGAGADLGSIGIPDLSGTNIFPFANTLKNGTNIYARNADTALLFRMNTGSRSGYINALGASGFTFANGTVVGGTNGTIIKSNGKLEYLRLDSAEVGQVPLNAASVLAGQFVTSATGSTNGFFDVQQSGWNTDGSGGMLFQSSGTGEFFVDNTGMYPRFATDNSLFLGVIGTPTSASSQTYSTNNEAWSKVASYRFKSPYSLVAPGTTGNKTINFPSGSIRIAAAGSSVVLTDSFITTNSIVYPVIATHDSTATAVQAVPATGSCSFFLNAAATSEVEIRFLVWNSGE